MLARASTKTFVSRVQKQRKKNLRYPKNSLAGSLVSRGITVHYLSYLAQFFLEMFGAELVEKIKTHILCSVTLFENFTVYEIMWEIVVQPDRPRMTRRHMRIACWITKSTKKH